MANVYLKNFMKYQRLVENFSGSDYSEFAKMIEDHIVPKVDIGEDRKAVVLFGFSGNGKSTWIKDFKEKNPDYAVLSMDTIVASSAKMLGRTVRGDEVVKYFSAAVDLLLKDGRNVLVDGNFLNLVTRMILVNSLHTGGYDVTLVDLTPQIDVTLEKRIMDVASRHIGVRLTPENIERYRNNPFYLTARQSVIEYHERERKSACVDEQKLLGLTSMGVEKVITVDTPKQGSVGGVKK